MILLHCKRFNIFCGGCKMTNERKEVSEAPVNFGANLGLMLDLYDDFYKIHHLYQKIYKSYSAQLRMMTQLYQL